MSAKTVFPSAPLLTVLGLCAAHGQSPPDTPYAPDTAPPGEAAAVAPPLVPGAEPPARLSDWILRGGTTSCGCFNPIGGDGPLQAELYFRGGPSLPIGGGVFDDTLQVGWLFQGGSRALLFNPAMDRAWAFDFSISSVWNHGKRPDIRMPLNILVPQDPANPVTPVSPDGTLRPVPVNFGTDPGVPGVSIRALNRTFVNLGVGRVWYLADPATWGGRTCRTGIDFGGRWGSAMAEFNEIRHRTDVIGGVWFAWQTDMEIPCGCCIFQAGFRAEWSYTWSDILQIQNNSDLMDVNLLLNLGVRF